MGPANPAETRHRSDERHFTSSRATWRPESRGSPRTAIRRASSFRAHRRFRSGPRPATRLVRPGGASPGNRIPRRGVAPGWVRYTVRPGLRDPDQPRRLSNGESQSYSGGSRAAARRAAAGPFTATRPGSRNWKTASPEASSLKEQLMASAVNPLTGSSASSSAASSSSASGISTPAPTEEMFLQLLVAQLQNQDPLNPTDSTTIRIATRPVQRTGAGHRHPQR